MHRATKIIEKFSGLGSYMSNAFRRIASPQVMIEESPDRLSVSLVRTTRRGHTRGHVMRNFRDLLAINALYWSFSLGAGMLSGMLAWDEIVWILPVAILSGVVLVGGYGLWLAVTIGECEDIVLNSSTQQIMLRRYFILPWCRLPWMYNRHATFHASYVEMKRPHKAFGIVSVAGKALCLVLDGKRCMIAQEWSQDDRERLYTRFRHYLPPQYDYALVSRVILGGSDNNILLEASYATLLNPDVTHLTQAMRALRQVDLYPQQCERRYVEQFITYAISYVGQKALKKHVVVHVHGCQDDVHINLRNSLANLCKEVYYMHDKS